MVKVASILATGAVARYLVNGIDRPLLPSVACLLTKRAWTAGLAVEQGIGMPTCLGTRRATRENMALYSNGKRKACRQDGSG